MPSTLRSGELSRAELGTLVGLVTGVQALATFAVLALATLAPRAAVSFGVGPELIGYQISLVYVASAMLSIFAGLFVRRHGAAATSCCAVLISALGLAGLASGHIAIALLASVTIGLGYGLTNPAASHLLWRFGPSRRRNLIFAVKQTGVPIGGMLAALLLPSLSERVGWQASLLIGATLHVVVGLMLWLRRRRWDDDRDPNARIQGALFDSLRMVMAVPKLRALAIMGFGFASSQLCLLSFTMTMLVEELGWTLVAAGGFAALMQIGGVAGRIAWSLIADYTGRGIEVLITIGVASAACALLLTSLTVAWPALALAALLFAFGFCLVGWNGLYMAEVARAVRPENVSLATGGVLVFSFAGIVLGPAAFATVYKAVGSYALTFGAFALLPLVGAAALVPVLLQQRRDRSSHP
jgi:MFS family permease